ncbi:MAG: hypothetical protein KC713_08785, partial [Candidatus Omnitrophica bacterium]|nr:hypothetical protein [Candidatus Omnitrophota bacterium]
ITDTLTLTGTSGSEIILKSDSDATRFTLDVTGGNQVVEYVDVKDSEASSNNIRARNYINNGGNDDGEAAPHWEFRNLLRGAIIIVE